MWCLLLIWLSSSVATMAAPPRMSIDSEGRLLESDGKVFTTRGINWGKRAMSPHTGESLYNSSDPILAKKLLPGLNHVRLVLDYYDPSGVCATDIFQESAPGHIEPKWLEYIDQAVAWTAMADLKISITLRNNYGTASPHGESTNQVPCEADYIGNATARELWFGTLQFLATRYRHAPNIAWYEPASEPHLDHGTEATRFEPCHTLEQIRALFEEAVGAIREVDKDTPIAVSPTGYSSCPGLSSHDKMSDNSIIYNMNWPCHLGSDASASYLTQVDCKRVGKLLAQCIPGCNGSKDASFEYNQSLIASLMQPTIAFANEHKVPLWIDQLMCAPGSEPNSKSWLDDSFGVVHQQLNTDLHFDWWTWKGDFADDPASMSVLVAPSKADKLDLSKYQIDDQVLRLYRSAIAPPEDDSV